MNITSLHEARTPEYWDRLYGVGYTPDPPSDFERQMLRAYTGAESGMRVLDVGCGKGQLSAHMADWGLTVTGIDFSLSAITAAREMHSGRELLDFRLHDVTAARYPVPDPCPVDIVVCRLAYEFIDGPRFEDRVRRWLRPGGILHITTTVSELMPPGVAHRGLPRARINELRSGWARMTWYSITQDSSFVGIVLKK